MIKSFSSLLIATLLITVLLIVSCGGAPSITTPITTTTPTTTPPTTTTPTTTEPGVYEIRVFWGMFYQPSFITVPVGSTVTFILVDGPDHDHPLGFDPPLEFSVTYSGKDTHLSYTFTKSGTFHFYCTEHGDSGTVLVK